MGDSDSAGTRTPNAIVAGPNEGDIVGALEREGATVTRLEDVVTRPRLEEAGIIDVDLYVLTDVGQATTIPIVRDLTDGVRTVAYAHDTIPEFVRGQIDLAIDPDVIDVSIVAEELVGAR